MGTILDRIIEIGPLLKSSGEKGDKDEKEQFCILQVEKMIKSLVNHANFGGFIRVGTLLRVSLAI